MTISLCMIVKNEEDTIGRCLDSVKDLFDEIIIVDTGSTDKTKQIALKYTDNLYDFDWVEDFSKARNYAFSKATSTYLMWLDADDIILEKDKEKLKQLIDSLDGKVRQVVMKYDAFMDEEGNVTLSYNRERIFLRSENFQFKGEIHETVKIEPDALFTDITITHKKIHPTEAGRNLRIFEKMITDGKKLNAREKFYYARELYYNGKIESAILIFNDFLNTPNAWIENKISACIDLFNCYLIVDKDEKALEALFKTFEYGKPRAEVCCCLGGYFKNLGKLNEAIYWFEEALKIKPDYKSGAFIMVDSYGYIPALELCVCYDKLKDFELAKKYNELAGTYKESKAVKANREYFKTLKIK